MNASARRILVFYLSIRAELQFVKERTARLQEMRKRRELLAMYPGLANLKTPWSSLALEIDTVSNEESSKEES